MALLAFYPYFIEKTTPVLMALFKECHVEEKSIKGLCVCFAFKMNEIVNEFVKTGVFEKFFRDECGESIDQFSSEVFRTKGRKRPPRELHLEHPPIIRQLLDELGEDWPFNDEKKTAPGKGQRK